MNLYHPTPPLLFFIGNKKMENTKQHKRPRVSERDVDRLLGSAAEDPFVKLIAMKHFQCGNDDVVYDTFQDEQAELLEAWNFMASEPPTSNDEKKNEDENAAVVHMEIEEEQNVVHRD